MARRFALLPGQISSAPRSRGTGRSGTESGTKLGKGHFGVVEGSKVAVQAWEKAGPTQFYIDLHQQFSWCLSV